MTSKYSRIHLQNPKILQLALCGVWLNQRDLPYKFTTTPNKVTCKQCLETLKEATND